MRLQTNIVYSELDFPFGTTDTADSTLSSQVLDFLTLIYNHDYFNTL